MEYLALEGGPPGFTRSSTSSVLLWYANRNGGLAASPTGLSPCIVELSRSVRLKFANRVPMCSSAVAPATPMQQRPHALTLHWFGLIRFRSPLLSESFLFSLPAATKMFQFTAFALQTYEFSMQYTGMTRYGLPHSEIYGSKDICSSP